MNPDPNLQGMLRELRKYKMLADKALVQVSEEQLFQRLDEESNNLAIIIKHMAGNMHSRWTHFLTSDGEKPDRNRDGEFELEESDTRATLLERWEAGWGCLFAALSALKPADLQRNVFIRGEPHTVVEAIQRQLTHYAYHVGQVVFLARHFAGARWQWLSIPKGRSKDIEVSKDGRFYDVEEGTSGA
ncbi:MAG: DUF1572 family protein [Planctomycetota bacterium]